MSDPRAPELRAGGIARREFLGSMLVAALAGIARPASANNSRRLVLVNTHTGEIVESVFWQDGLHRPGGLGRLDWAFRDHRQSSMRPIDARLFDLLHELAGAAGVEPRYHVISGYRSPATNAMLAAARGGGVSSRSLHMAGQAVDVRLAGVPLTKLRDLALERRAGGVGYYPASDFVHLDVGRVRAWSG